MRVNTPNSYSGQKRVRSFEKAALHRALQKSHLKGNHEEYQQRDCPACEYDGPRPELKVNDNE